ncbi:MAG: hypothetical protein LC795_00690 [Acidobacteria bacterium]|nr:hypothetical protein [Acidobacteriota bacterium]
MLNRTILSLALLLPTAPPLRAGQSPAPQRPVEKLEEVAPQKDAADAQDAAEAEAAQRRETLLAELRALESESGELLKPTDAAAARAEVAAAAWTLEREWAKSLLREALALTFPAEVDRARLRDRPIGAALRPGPAEDGARGRVRRRVFQIAARDREFARELGETAARELGRVEGAERSAAMAAAAADEGRLEEAETLIMRSAEEEPTLINVGEAINHVAARDRAAADRLILAYIERLRQLPLSVFTERNHTSLRVPLSFAWMLQPQRHPFPGAVTPPPPAGREVVRAYVAFIIDTMTRIEQSGGDPSEMHGFVTIVWPHMLLHAPEYAAQLAVLERASRRPGQKPPPLRSFVEIGAFYGARREERLKLARQTKDPLDLEMAASSAMGRKDFEEARKLVGMLKDGELKSQLTEQVNTRESLHLLGAGDLAGAERLARQLNNVSSIQQAYPPLVRRLAKQTDAGRAALLADEAARRLLASAEKNPANDTFTPTLLAPVAGSIRIYKQTRALEAMSELALAVEPAAPQVALDLLDALVETARKARVTSEHGNPNFNPEAFARLSAAGAGRVRSAAARLEDRLQRLSALAAVCRGEAERLAQKTEGAARR